MAKKPAKKAAPKVAEKPKGIVITVDEVLGLPMGAARRGDRPDVPEEVAARLVKEKLAEYV